MDFQTLAQREPELLGIERACRAARQQGANWHDFWATHVGQLTRLVGPVARCPGLRSKRAWNVVRAHLLQAWIDAMAEPSALPWDSRPGCHIASNGNR